MVHGDPGFDVWGMDVARLANGRGCATPTPRCAKTIRAASRSASPTRNCRPHGRRRPRRSTTRCGEERRHGRFLGAGDAAVVRAERHRAQGHRLLPPLQRFRACRQRGARRARRVGVTEIANFAKYEVSGAGAEDFLNRLMTNRMPKKGRIVLTPMLNEFGKLIGDFTIAKAGDEKFMIWGSSAAQKYHMRWFEKHLPKDGSVRIHRFDQTLVGLSIAGPKPRRCCRNWSTRTSRRRPSASWISARWRSAARPAWSTASPIPAISATRSGCSRPTSGWSTRRSRTPAQEFGIVDFGMRALLSMRLEKNFPTWFRELRPIYGPFEGAMDRFIKMEKNDFIGREAAAKEQADRPETAPRLAGGRRGRCRRDGRRADLGEGRRPGLRHGREAARLRRAALRRGGQGGARLRRRHGASAVRGITDGEWRVVGWVTSGGFAHSCRQVAGARLCAGAHLPRTRATACSRSRSSATAGRRASMSSRCSIRPARRCGGS